MAPGGGLIISDVDNRASATSRPNRSILGRQRADRILSAVGQCVSGDLTITNNPNLSVINVRSLIPSAATDNQRKHVRDDHRRGVTHDCFG